MHFVDSFIHVPVSTKPSLIVDGLLNLVQPALRAVIYGALVNPLEEHFRRYIFERAGMREDYVDFLLCNLLLNIRLDLFRRLFIWPPVVAFDQAVVFIYAVGASDDQMIKTFKVVDLAIFGEQQIGVLLLVPNDTSVPHFCFVCGNV